MDKKLVEGLKRNGKAEVEKGKCRRRELSDNYTIVHFVISSMGEFDNRVKRRETFYQLA